MKRLRVLSLIFLLLSITATAHHARLSYPNLCKLNIKVASHGRYKLVSIKLFNKSNDSIQCSPFFKAVKRDKSDGLGCDTIDYATYMITCNHCDKFQTDSTYYLSGHDGPTCSIHWDKVSKNKGIEFKEYYNSPIKKTLVIRLFSIIQGRGIKLYIPLSQDSKGKTLKYAATNVVKFDE